MGRDCVSFSFESLCCFLLYYLISVSVNILNFFNMVFLKSLFIYISSLENFEELWKKVEIWWIAIVTKLERHSWPCLINSVKFICFRKDNAGGECCFQDLVLLTPSQVEYEKVNCFQCLVMFVLLSSVSQAC